MFTIQINVIVIMKNLLHIYSARGPMIDLFSVNDMRVSTLLQSSHAKFDDDVVMSTTYFDFLNFSLHVSEILIATVHIFSLFLIQLDRNVEFNI